MEKVETYKLENKKRIKTNILYTRDSDESLEGLYIVGVNNWIINSEGKFLVQRRALTKKNNPGKWSSTNGLIKCGESAIKTIQRETEEELGINIENSPSILVEESHIAGEHLLVDIFLTIADVKLDDISVQESEVDAIRYVSLEELQSLDFSTTCSYIRKMAPEIYEIFKNYKEKKKQI